MLVGVVGCVGSVYVVCAASSVAEVWLIWVLDCSVCEDILYCWWDSGGGYHRSLRCYGRGGELAEEPAALSHIIVFVFVVVSDRMVDQWVRDSGGKLRHLPFGA